MNKKKISVNNPRGVEYPEAVIADGTLVSAVNLDKERVKCEGIKFYFPGCEGDEEEEMLFIERKHKNGVTKYFRHRPGYIEDRNEPDRYLHNYSELRLKHRFDESEKTGEFIVQYYIETKCPNYGECKVKDDEKCQGKPKLTLKKLNLRDYYDTCTIEKGKDKYIADLLLENSKKSIPPIMLEVFVTHECTEEKKNSGIGIIEIKIEKKEDADNEIIENAGELVDDYLFMKPYNKPPISPIRFYGFDRSAYYTEYLSYGNFLLTKNENGYYADYKTIACNEVNNHVPDGCAFSLSVPLDELKNIDLYEMGMAKAHDLGLKIRDCTLCNQYRRPTQYIMGNIIHSCRLTNLTYTYKDQKGRDRQIQNPFICQMPYRCNGFDKSQQAAGCGRYSLDNQRIANLVRMLESKHHQMWVDESLLPTQSIVQKTNPPFPETDHEETRKLLTPQECFDCPIYRDTCAHHLGTAMKGDKSYVICDWKKPR